MGKAILCDIHGTLLNKDTDEPIHSMVDLVKCLSKSYEILLITANFYIDHKKLIELTDIVDVMGIKYKILFYRGRSIRNDAAIKYDLYNSYIKGKYEVLLTIDNNKSCFKMWREIGLDSLRFGESKEDSDSE